MGGDEARAQLEATTEPELAPPFRALFRLVAPYLSGHADGIEARLPYDLEIR